MNMKKKILAICILLAIWSVVSYAQEFFIDGEDTLVYCGCFGKRQVGVDKWRQIYRDLGLKVCRDSGYYNINLIEKLSNDDVRLINKALQKFEIMEDEIYNINVLYYGRSYGKTFCVLIKSKGQWDFVGMWYNYD